MKKSNRIRIVWVCIIACFLLMISPLILYFNKTNAAVCHIPLIYAFVFLIWVILCVLTFIGYKLRWGSKDDD